MHSLAMYETMVASADPRQMGGRDGATTPVSPPAPSLSGGPNDDISPPAFCDCDHPMSGRWFRVYDDLVNDPKVQRLPPELFKTLINLWCIASSNNGALPNAEDIAFKLRCKEGAAEASIAALMKAGLIEEDENGVLSPHNWRGRQFQSDVSTERVKRFRERSRNVSVTAGETPPDTETDTEHTSHQTVDEDFVENSLFGAVEMNRPESQDISPIVELMTKGYDLGKDIIPVVKDMASKANGSIASWRYFVAGITRAKKLNDAIPENLKDKIVVPMTWELADGPNWTVLSARWLKEKGKLPPRIPGIGGMGWQFPTAWFEQVSV